MSAIWKKGPPPLIGWWQASVQRNPRILRWWDGERWSWGAFRGQSLKAVETAANRPIGVAIGQIQWKDRPKFWPKRSKT